MARSSFGYHRMNTRAIPSSNLTHGTTNGFAYIQDGTVFMKGDDTTWLADGEFRNRFPLPRSWFCPYFWFPLPSLSFPFKWRLRRSVLFQMRTNIEHITIHTTWDSSSSISTVHLGDARSGPLDGLLAEVSGPFSLLTDRRSSGCFLTPESNFTGAVVRKQWSKQHQLRRNNPSPTQVAAYKNGVGL
ncbi:hypothetical protein K435DRAFT_802822 [Dendrothele bispora CBS 962.96]|uniref:Uncharacterized protein n=1 Tax=Dendrothele bispora (strain CBS 962.96) TaxID=1314807 RepID=A0A4S8LK54_DENBC|nr:hypothetical protein K435DRAFT_802822 [Dendrothele bispora CBS 962.96]